MKEVVSKDIGHIAVMVKVIIKLLYLLTNFNRPLITYIVCQLQSGNMIQVLNVSKIM